MSGIVDGKRVAASESNAAWLAKNGDDTTIGKLNLGNTEAESGAPVVNAQREINSLNAFTGRASGSTHNGKPAWAASTIGTTDDTLKDRAEALTAFGEAHGHTGAAGDGEKIDVLQLYGTQLREQFVKGPSNVIAIGSSIDVSGIMFGVPVSSGPTVKGASVAPPYNYVIVLRANGLGVFSDSTARVFGRISNSGGSGGTWALAFFSIEGGVETPFSFGSSTELMFYYRRLYDETTRQVYEQTALADIDKSFVGNIGTFKSEVITEATTEGQTVFPISYEPLSDDSLVMLVDTVPNLKDKWTRVGATVTFNEGIPVGRQVAAFYARTQFGGGGGGGTGSVDDVAHYHTLTTGEVTAKAITLPATPRTSSRVLLDVIGGCAQVFGEDFTVAGSILSWSGLGLDGILEAGDKLRVYYLT